MTDIEIIEKILKSNKPSDVFSGDWKKEYTRYSNLIHPDKCSHKNASNAMSKLNEYKSQITKGIPHIDDSGTLKRFDKKIIYTINDINKKLITKSYNNFISLQKKANNHYLNYLPDSMSLEKDKLIINLKFRAIPLVDLELEQKHVNWVFSRLFEFTLFTHQFGYAHMGLNPETVYVAPKEHGIICTSFYHLTKLNNRAKTVSTRYKNWYPTALFNKKIATLDIDLELSKKIALYLLGDKSGAGTKLRRNNNINQNMLNFLLTKHEGTFEDYDNYRKLLAKNFEKKFYELVI